MPHSFSFKTFFRHASVELLRRYFDQFEPLRDIDWSEDKTVLVDRLYAKIETLPDNLRVQIEQELLTISELSTEAYVVSVQEFIRIECNTAETIIDQMMEQIDFLNQVFWFRLSQPKWFEQTLTIYRVEQMTFREICRVGKNLACDLSEKAVDQLKQLLQAHFKRQRRGRHCKIDTYYFNHPQRYIFCAYPEDYPRRDLTYNDQAMLLPVVRRPVMEIVFVYEPQSGQLKINCGKMRNVKTLQESFCKSILGLEGIPSDSTRVYDLSVLLDPSFRFATDPKDGVEHVYLKMLTAMVGDETIVLEGSPETNGLYSVRDNLKKALEACFGPKSPVFVKSAKIKMTFRGINGGRSQSVTFMIAAPSRVGLKDKPHHHLAGQYLERWGLIRKAFTDSEQAA